MNVTNTVPMNRKERRAAGVKVEPKTVAFTLAYLNRHEKVGDDGTVFAQTFFRIVAPNGKELMEETPDGPMPVVLASIPQPVRRQVIATGPRLVTR